MLRTPREIQAIAVSQPRQTIGPLQKFVTDAEHQLRVRFQIANRLYVQALRQLFFHTQSRKCR